MAEQIGGIILVLQIDKSEEGLTVVAEALAVVDRTGERHYEAELYRLKGELMLKQSGVWSSESPTPNT